MEIGKKLKNARIEAGLTQEKAAEKIDVSRQTISNWDWSNSFKYYTDDTVDCAEHAVAGRNLLSGNCILCGNHEFIGIALSDYQTDLGGRLLWDGIK